MLAAALDVANAIDDANHSSYHEQVPEHFLVAEPVEELAALVQGSNPLAEPYHIVVVPCRSHPDTQAGTVALRSSHLGCAPQAGSLAEIQLVVAVPMSLGGFAFAVRALETRMLVGAMVAVEMTAAEPLLADLYSQLARLVAVMM